MTGPPETGVPSARRLTHACSWRALPAPCSAARQRSGAAPWTIEFGTPKTDRPQLKRGSLGRTKAGAVSRRQRWPSRLP